MPQFLAARIAVTLPSDLLCFLPTYFADSATNIPAPSYSNCFEAEMYVPTDLDNHASRCTDVTILRDCRHPLMTFLVDENKGVLCNVR